MDYKIRGTIMQVVDFDLKSGDSLFTEKGGMSWMSDGILMETNTRGGIMKGLGRMLSGESFFLTTYTCQATSGKITFSSEFPGNVIELKLKQGEEIICQKDAFMVAQGSVKLESFFHKRLGAGLFGGEGFVLQKVTGPGVAFLEISGEITEYTLKDGELLKVDPGHIAAFEPTVDHSIEVVSGLKNIFFAGEGLFLGTLRGPGKVWLQSMPIPNLAMRLYPYLPIKNQG